jgi:hypothetical protein
MRVAALCLVLVLSGCHMPYRVPNDAADFEELGLREPGSGEDVAAAMERRPEAVFPATVATVRLQGRQGPFVVTVREVEAEGGLERVARLPGVKAVVPVNGLACPGQVASFDEVRAAAAGVHADLVLAYTFETTSKSETTIPVLGVLTLGIFPNEVARAVSTGTAALIDTRSGYVYGVVEATDKEYRITNAWNVWSAQQTAEEGVRVRACRKLVGEVERMWGEVGPRLAP